MFVAVNGIDLHCDIRGQGIPCLVPRALNTSIMERTLSSRLYDHFQFIFFDVRGSGRSGGTVEDCTLDQVPSVIHFVPVAQIAPAHLWLDARKVGVEVSVWLLRAAYPLD